MINYVKNFIPPNCFYTRKEDDGSYWCLKNNTNCNPVDCPLKMEMTKKKLNNEPPFKYGSIDGK